MIECDASRCRLIPEGAELSELIGKLLKQFISGRSRSNTPLKQGVNENGLVLL